MAEDGAQDTVVSPPVQETMEAAAAASDDSGSESGSGSDSDSGSDAEAEYKMQVEALESELYDNPSSYDAHVQYIKLLRKMGEIEKLRQAREAMSALFPLTPSMWQEWARDEASLSSGPDACPIIEKLYERGISDYLSVPLWNDYISFVRENDPTVRECSPAGISKARNLFERAITAAGLHVAEGNKIWEAYQEFEQAIFHTIDIADTEAQEKQVQRIRTLFHRQLSIPLINLESSLLAYKAWEAEQGNGESIDMDNIYPHVAAAYRKALDMSTARVQFEEEITRGDLSDAERLQNYLLYLKFEQASGDPARVQVLYERAVTDFPISSDLWLNYTGYLDRTLKVGNVVRDVHVRATRNCPWVAELWVRYLLYLERSRSSETQISAVFEKSLLNTFATLEEYLDLYLTRIDGLRRRISFSGEVEDPLDYLLIRETFQRASDYLSPHFKNIEGLLHLYGYWARLEVKLGKDVAAARGVWESLLKICGSMLEAWRGYITMEIELDRISEARSIYKRCYSKRFPGRGSEEICHSWLRFERDLGKLEDYEYAVQKVTPRLEELKLFALQQESQLIDAKENDNKKNVREKRKSTADIADEESPLKKQRNTSSQKKMHDVKKPIVENVAEEDKMQGSKRKNDEADNTNEVEMKDSHPDKPKIYTDQCTAFISNLDLKVNNDHLHGFFKDVGGVTAIRILHDKFTGKSRGLAYVDFVDDERLTAAVAKNKRMLLGKRVSIARSDPKKGRKECRAHDSGDQIDRAGKSAAKDDVDKRAPPKSESTSSRRNNVELKGRNTFAMPRSVIKPLGWSATQKPNQGEENEKPKSNEEFKQMLLKK